MRSRDADLSVVRETAEMLRDAISQENGNPTFLYLNEPKKTFSEGAKFAEMHGELDWSDRLRAASESCAEHGFSWAEIDAKSVMS